MVVSFGGRSGASLCDVERPTLVEFHKTDGPFSSSFYARDFFFFFICAPEGPSSILHFIDTPHVCTYIKMRTITHSTLDILYQGFQLFSRFSFHITSTPRTRSLQLIIMDKAVIGKFTRAHSSSRTFNVLVPQIITPSQPRQQSSKRQRKKKTAPHLTPIAMALDGSPQRAVDARSAKRGIAGSWTPMMVPGSYIVRHFFEGQERARKA